jgi:hypothetical protein
MGKWYLGGVAAMVALALMAASAWTRHGQAAQAKEPLIVHSVYFALKDNSPREREKLVNACKKYLTRHPGEVYFAAGVLADEFNRPINDRDFDVALLIVFENKKAHDQYQEAARHQQFIEENKANWKKVRVFDAVVQP